MNGTSDIHRTETLGDADGLDPREAARLLAHTKWEAQRGLDFRSPGLTLIAAGVALVAFGAVWLSVRGQHPYKGPTAGAVWVLCVVLVIRIATVVAAARRARAGVSGRSVRLWRAEVAAGAAALVAVLVFRRALVHDGASHAIVNGVYLATAPLIVLATLWAGRSAAQEDWPALTASIAIVLVAASSAFAGPRGVWLSQGVGVCVVLLGCAAAQVWLLRAPRSNP